MQSAYSDSTLDVNPARETKKMFMSPRVLIVHLEAVRANDISGNSEGDAWTFVGIEAQVGKLSLG